MNITRIEIPINTTNPMNGIFSEMRSKSLLSHVSVTQSSIYSGRSPASRLIDHDSSISWASNNEIGQYFEITFLESIF